MSFTLNAKSVSLQVIWMALIGIHLNFELQIKKGEFIMAKNHKIFVHRNSENIHMKLSGDFDGSLASELLNLLKKNCNTA